MICPNLFGQSTESIESMIRLLNAEPLIKVEHGILIPKSTEGKSTLAYKQGSNYIRVERKRGSLKYYLNGEKINPTLLRVKLLFSKDITKIMLWNRILSEQQLEQLKEIYK